MRRPFTWFILGLLGALGLFTFWATAHLLQGLHELIGEDAFGIDLRLMQAMWLNTPPEWGPFLQFCSSLLAGYTWPIWAVVLILSATLLWSRGFRPEAVGTASAAVLAVVGVVIAKLLFQRDRPGVEWATALETSFSFPSGHSAHAVVVYGMAAYLAGRVTRRWSVGLVLALPALLMIAATAYSRIYLGVHYPSDVLAGLSIGTLWLATTIAFTEILYLRRRQELAERVDRAAARVATGARDLAQVVRQRRGSRAAE